MNTRQLITLAATGGAAYAVSRFTGDQYNQPDGIPVRDGVLQWDERFNDVERGYIYDEEGNAHQIGTVDAMSAMYDTAAEYALLSTKCTRILRQSLSEDQIRTLDSTFQGSGRFDLTGLSASQRAMCQTMVNSFVNFGQALRLLAFTYAEAGFERMWRPAKWERREFDLSAIVHQSILNPLVYRSGSMQYQPRVQRVVRPVGWKYVGWEIIQNFLDAYDIQIEGEHYLIEDMQRDGEDLAASPGSVQTTAMGAIPVIAWGIALVVVALGVSYVIATAPESLSMFLGRNLSFMRNQADAYESARECAVDPERTAEERQICASEAARIADEISSYTPSWSTWITLGLLGATGAGGYYIYKKVKGA